MRKARIMGSYIRYLAEKKGITNSELASILNCTETNIYELYRGLVYPSYGQMLVLSNKIGISVKEIVEANEELYNSSLNEELGEFSNNDNREELLDIIENYIDLAKAVQKKRLNTLFY